MVASCLSGGDGLAELTAPLGEMDAAPVHAGMQRRDWTGLGEGGGVEAKLFGCRSWIVWERDLGMGWLGAVM